MSLSPNSPLRLVVFDVDGTLIDSQDFIMAAMMRAFEGMGVALPSRTKVLSTIGLSLEQAIDRMVPGLGTEALTEAASLYKQAFVSLHKESGGEAEAPLYPGARQALESLHGLDEVLLGVATGKAKRGLDHVCKVHDFDQFFVTRQTADGHPSKPHPSMLTATLAETGVKAAHAVMIGDTSYDIEMGRAAGFRTIGVTWGYHKAEDLQEAGADVLINNFSALRPALEKFWGQA